MTMLQTTIRSHEAAIRKLDPPSLGGIAVPPALDRYVALPADAGGFNVVDRITREWIAWDAGEQEARALAADKSARKRAEEWAMGQAGPFTVETDR